MRDKNMKPYRLNREERYPDGYQPKIGYWNYKLNKAINNLDAEGIKFASERLAYFVLREQQRIERLEQAYS